MQTFWALSFDADFARLARFRDISPHFLNNTPEIINRELRLADNERVSAMIGASSVMLNTALDRDGRSHVGHCRERQPPAQL